MDTKDDLIIDEKIETNQEFLKFPQFFLALFVNISIIFITFWNLSQNSDKNSWKMAEKSQNEIEFKKYVLNRIHFSISQSYFDKLAIHFW